MVEVALVAVNDWRVVLPRTRKLLVVVAPPKIVRPEPVVLLPMVEEAREYRPALKPIKEVVALWVPKSANELNGKAKVEEPQPVQLVTVKLPMLAMLERSSVVEARLETWRLVEVELDERRVVIVLEPAVKAWRVEEPLSKRFVM